MEDPVAEIPHVIHTLCQAAPSKQRAALEKYFTPSASFTHPICRTGSFNGSRWLIWCIYRWYKVMSPRIEMGVDSVAFDQKNLILYVSCHQFFRIWALPIFSARASLVTVLHLVPDRPEHFGRTREPTPVKYLIKAQNDLYQASEIARYVSPFGILSTLVVVLQLFATAMCVLGAAVGWPVTWVEENVLGGNQERSLEEVVKG
ncbi:hypothetical protein MMC07_000331 [Pseudocyphellaria aurata]|nr:hypothetical protein [Pseudocyphellaria aurata]